MTLIISQESDPDIREQTRVLHRLEFFERDTDYENGHRVDLEKALEKRQVVFASKNGTLLGFGMYSSLNETERHSLWWYESIFKDQRILAEFTRLMQEKIDRYNLQLGKAKVQLFENEFTRHYQPKPNDVYFAGMIVAKEHRGEGIATTIVNTRLNIAKRQGASSVFVDCCLDDGVQRIFERLGFSPAVSLYPADAKGATYLNMGLKL